MIPLSNELVRDTITTLLVELVDARAERKAAQENLRLSEARIVLMESIYNRIVKEVYNG